MYPNTSSKCGIGNGKLQRPYLESSPQEKSLQALQHKHQCISKGIPCCWGKGLPVNHHPVRKHWLVKMDTAHPDSSTVKFFLLGSPLKSHEKKHVVISKLCAKAPVIIQGAPHSV